MKVGIYCRVSSLSQSKEGYSIDNQKVRGIEYCDKLGYDYEIFEDVISGSKVNRKGLDDLFGKVLMGEINGILLYEWSRLSREKRLMVKLEDLLKEVKDCKIIVDGEERDILGDDGDRIEYEVSGFLSSYERFRLMKRVKDGSINRLKKGFIRSQLKRGFKKVKGVVEIDEKESLLIKNIFKVFLYKNIKNVKELTDTINKKYGLKLTDSTLKKYLVWEGYNGIIHQKYKEFETDIEIPKIIDDETFRKVGLKVKDILGKRKGRDSSEYLLKGMVYCKDCGGKMYKRGSVKRKGYKKNKDGSKRKSFGEDLKYVRDFHYYNCSVNGYRKSNESEEEFELRKSQCSSYKKNSINFGILDKVVWDGLFQFLNMSDTVLEFYNKKSKTERENFGKMKGKKGYYIRRIEELKSYKYQLYKDWKGDKVGEDDYNTYNTDFIKEITDCELRINEIDSYEIKEVNSEVMENVVQFMVNDLENKKKIGDRYFLVSRLEGESDEKYFKRKNIGLKDMKVILGKYLNRVYVKRLGEEEYNINFDFGIVLSNSEKGILKNMVLKNNKSLFYIKNQNIYQQFSYVEENIFTYSFNFRYCRVNKLGKFFLYNFKIENEIFEVVN